MINNVVSSINLRLLAVCLAAMTLTGCASSRAVIAPKFEAAVNPAQGVAVRIDSIQDARVFELRPRVPSIPSLMNGEITDEAIRSRAIARKRNGYGMAMGDVLLPEGQTVSTLSVAAITRSFRESGYRVVVPSDADYAQAAPVTVRIDKLWAWVEIGFFSGSLLSNYELTLNGPIVPLQQGLAVTGQVSNSVAFATEGAWSAIISKSLDDLDTKLKAKLAAK
jgi:hypothetical protein